MGVEYNIETLEDILQLDDRQREAFILDLREWLKYMDAANGVCDKLSVLGVKVSSRGMVWKDDGIIGLTGVQIDVRAGN